MPESPSSKTPRPPLTLVERIAAAIPLLLILSAIVAPIWATVTDHAETKMGKLGGAPALMYSIVAVHIAMFLSNHYRKLWRGNDYLAMTLPAIVFCCWAIAAVFVLARAGGRTN